MPGKARHATRANCLLCSVVLSSRGHTSVSRNFWTSSTPQKNFEHTLQYECINKLNTGVPRYINMNTLHKCLRFYCLLLQNHLHCDCSAYCLVWSATAIPQIAQIINSYLPWQSFCDGGRSPSNILASMLPASQVNVISLW